MELLRGFFKKGAACNGEQLPLFSRQIPPLLWAREACLRAILVIAASEQVGARGIATCFQPSVPASGSVRQFYEDPHEMACFASGLFAVCPRFLFGVSFSFIEVSMVSKKARAAAACAGLGGCWPQSLLCSTCLNMSRLAFVATPGAIGANAWNAALKGSVTRHVAAPEMVAAASKAPFLCPAPDRPFPTGHSRDR